MGGGHIKFLIFIWVFCHNRVRTPGVNDLPSSDHLLNNPLYILYTIQTTPQVLPNGQGCLPLPKFAHQLSMRALKRSSLSATIKNPPHPHPSSSTPPQHSHPQGNTQEGQLVNKNILKGHSYMFMFFKCQA